MRERERESMSISYMKYKLSISASRSISVDFFTSYINLSSSLPGLTFFRYFHDAPSPVVYTSLTHPMGHASSPLEMHALLILIVRFSTIRYRRKWKTLENCSVGVKNAGQTCYGKVNFHINAKHCVRRVFFEN